MNATRKVTLPMLAATARLPTAAAHVTHRRATVADWDSEQVRDAAAKVIATDDAYDMCGHSDQVMRVCREIELLDAELDLARGALADAQRVIADQKFELDDMRHQLAAMRAWHDERGVELADERAKSKRTIDQLEKMRAFLMKLERERVTVALERLTVTVTGRSSEEISAHLNDTIRPQRSANLDHDDIVIDVDGVEVEPIAGSR